MPGTVWGRIWLVLRPGLDTALCFVVVGLIISGAGAGTESFAAFLVVGILMFQSTMRSTSQGPGLIRRWWRPGAVRFDAVAYTARQSLLSTDHDASHQFPEGVEIDSEFQRRMMTGDFAGNLGERLTEAAPTTDVFLWDLADERHGVHLFEDGTVVTRSIDNVRHPEVVSALESARHLPFGTDEHFRLWSERAERIRELLRSLGIFEKTIVLQVPWALITVDGSPTPWSMGTSAKDANAAYLRYYEQLRELGFTLIELQPLGVLADPEHRWGLAPFHYTQDVYEEIAQRVLTHLGEQGSDATSSGQD